MKNIVYWPDVLSVNELLAFMSRDVEEKERKGARREHKRRNRRPNKM